MYMNVHSNTLVHWRDQWSVSVHNEVNGLTYNGWSVLFHALV